MLYGESYGTELAQAYAAAHPDRLSALILDGAVDLTRRQRVLDLRDEGLREGPRPTPSTRAPPIPIAEPTSADPHGQYDAFLRRFDPAIG